MLNRISISLIVLFGFAAFASTANSQEVPPQDSAVVFDGSQPLYAWQAYITFPNSGVPVFVGEVITNQPFAFSQVVNHAISSQPVTGTTGQMTTQPAFDNVITSDWQGGQIIPSPGGC